MNALYWSVRRELWENRSIYIAPIVVSVVVLFGSCFSAMTLPKRLRAVTDPARLESVIVQPFAMAPAPVMFITLIVAVFYCLDALHGERRDRSILFWKSLPVSDLTTVLSKATIALVVLPVIGLALGALIQRVLIVLGSMVLAGSGFSPARLWARLPLFESTFVMVYGVVAHVLWYAPIYAWLLLVSAWAKRATFLWAILPAFAIALLERIASNSNHFAMFLKYRLAGAMTEAFAIKQPGHQQIIGFAQLDPLKFLTSAGLWLGLIAAAMFLAAAVRLRRYREPI